MKGSKWLILIVIVIVVGVVIAKQIRNSSQSPEPEVVAQAPTQGEPAQPALEVEGPDKGASAPPTQVEQEPVSKPEASSSGAKPAGGDQSRTPALVKAPNKPAANPRPEPPAEQPAEQKPALGPKPEGPLPGSKLKDCLKNGLPPWPTSAWEPANRARRWNRS